MNDSERDAIRTPEITVHVGDVYRDDDHRHHGRIVTVVGLDALNARVRVETTSNPNRPGGVGRQRWVKLGTLRRRYTEISH